MTTQPTLTLADFLLARIGEDELAEYQRLTGGEPKLLPIAEKSLAGRSITLRARSRDVGVALCDAIPFLRYVNRKIAARYSNHPDYDESWRP